MVEIASQRIELLGPETLVVGDPHGGLLHGRGMQLAAHHASFLRAGDQAGRFQHGQVFHEAGQRHLVLLRQLRDGATAVAQLRQHAAPRGIGQRREDQVQLGIFIVNHKV